MRPDLSGAYGASTQAATDAAAAERRRQLAATWTRNAELEALLALEASDREALLARNPPLRLQLAGYVAGRAARVAAFAVNAAYDRMLDMDPAERAVIVADAPELAAKLEAYATDRALAAAAAT